MLRGRCSCAISGRPRPSPAPKKPLSPIIPVHPGNSPVSPIIPVRTQKQGVGSPDNSYQRPAISDQEARRKQFLLPPSVARHSPLAARHQFQLFPHHWQLLPYESYPLPYLPLHHVSMSARRHFRTCTRAVGRKSGPTPKAAPFNLQLSTFNHFSPLSLIIPAHPSDSPVSPIIPAHTQ